jgi:hypothetical protein
VQLLMRADDPLFELAMMVFAHRMEDRHWQQTPPQAGRLPRRQGCRGVPDGAA